MTRAEIADEVQGVLEPLMAWRLPPLGPSGGKSRHVELVRLTIQ